MQVDRSCHKAQKLVFQKQMKSLNLANEERNYVKDNFNKAVFEMKPPQKAEKTEEIAQVINKNYGKVPNYLNKFHKQREDEMKRKA